MENLGLRFLICKRKLKKNLSLSHNAVRRIKQDNRFEKKIKCYIDSRHYLRLHNNLIAHVYLK